MSAIIGKQDFPTLPGSDYYRADATGVYRINSEAPEKGEYLEIPFPIPVGITWLMQPPEKKAVAIKAEKANALEIAGHKYVDCIKLTYTYPDNTRISQYYLARGVGVVKFVITNLRSNPYTMELLLQKYKL